MSTDVHDEGGLLVTRFQGPEVSGGGDRTRWQVSVSDPRGYAVLTRDDLKGLAGTLYGESFGGADARVQGAIEHMAGVLLERASEAAAPSGDRPTTVADMLEGLADAMRAAGRAHLARYGLSELESLLQFDEYVEDDRELVPPSQREPEVLRQAILEAISDRGGSW